MSSSCTTIPTLTRTTAVTTRSTSTIVSSSVTTSPPSTTFITSIGTTCSPVIEGTPSCQTTTQVTNSTIPGATSTVGITQTTVVPVTSSVVNTLYSTSCTVISSSNGGSVITSTPSSSSSSSSSVTPSMTTLTSMSSSTAANGSVIMTQVTETSTISPSTSSASTASGVHGTTSTSSSNLAPIIGGSVGGFFGLSAIVLLAWYLWKRKQNWDNIFAEDPILNDAFPEPKRDPGLDSKPKPYQYGLVGHSAVPPHMSPPSTGLSLSSEGNAQPLSHNTPLSQQQSTMQQQSVGQQQQQSSTQQQSVGQQQQQSAMQQQSVAQQQQQQSVIQQSQNSVGQQQQSQAVMQQQQQSIGPNIAQQLPNQQTYGGLPAPSSHNHAIPVAAAAVASLSHRPTAIAAASVASLSPRPSAITAASVASLSPRPSATSNMSSQQDGSSSLSTISVPGPWAGPGGGLYPPGMQRNFSATAGPQVTSHPGAALGIGQRQSIIDENEVYGGIAVNTAVAGSSGATNALAHTYGHPPGVGPSARIGQDLLEFDPYQEQQQPARERRDGKGRLVKGAQRPPVVHLDGGRYRAPLLSPGPSSLGTESIMAPPAYSA